jgi:putative SOS response-associated peptidase YedK
MCNDYQRHIEWDAYCAALAAAKLGMPADADPDQLPPAADTRVNDIAPIMRASGNLVELTPLRWGFPPSRPGGAPVFNFRSEGRRFDRSNRCLIPASAFFEFTGKTSPRSKWRFELVGSSILAIAGLWRDGAGEEPATFTMLTTSPGADIKPFHDRQVVVLPVQDWASWLYLERPEAEILRPLPSGSLTVSLERPGREAPEPSLMALAGR